MKKITINDRVIILSNGFISKKIDFKKIEDAYVEFFNLCFETKNKKKISFNLIGLRSLDLEDILYEKIKKYNC